MKHNKQDILDFLRQKVDVKAALIQIVIMDIWDLHEAMVFVEETDPKAYSYIFNQLSETTDEFIQVAHDLESLLNETVELEKELNHPINLNYIKLLKMIRAAPIPRLPKL